MGPICFLQKRSVACVLLIANSAAAFAASTTQPALISPGVQHDELVDDIQSGDSARASKAIADIQAYLTRFPLSYKRELTALLILLDAKQYALVEKATCDLILKNPSVAESVAAYEKQRAEAFLDAGDTAAALGAAKAYYNAALLKDTADAMDTVALCLLAAHPNDPTVAQRFKEQQVAWATTAPSTQPDDPPADSVLAGIVIDSKPFDAAISRISLRNYKNFASKGNLLLIAGKAAEAHKLFEQAVAIAPGEKAGEARENVARAIRAESGCIAPANAYIVSMQGKK